MNSKELAKRAGKLHKNVLRDIRVMITATGNNKAVSIVYTPGGKMKEINMSKSFASLMLEKYKGLARVPYRLQEEASLKTVEQLKGITLIRQYEIGGYRIDGYDPENNVAYEIDEPAHQTPAAIKKDNNRQKKIKALLGCKFVRIKL